MRALSSHSAISAPRRCARFFVLLVLPCGFLLPCFAGFSLSLHLEPWRMQQIAQVEMSASRRDVMIGAALSQAELQQVKPICEVQLHRVKPVQGQVGGQFASISALLGGKSVELMLDTGLSEGMVTPSLAKQLKLPSVGSAEGATATGGATVELVELRDLILECGELLAPVTAAVASFPEENIDENWSLTGMLGYQVLQNYDADIDFPRGKLRLWRPGEGGRFFVFVCRNSALREM
ncbi:unnamed protein product [Effrenium voratum]|nr:unnamed protein product [Effrenium voratum]